MTKNQSKESYLKDYRSFDQYEADVANGQKREKTFIKRFEAMHSEPINIISVEVTNEDGVVRTTAKVKQSIDFKIHYSLNENSKVTFKWVEVKCVKRFNDAFFYGVKISQFNSHIRLAGDDGYNLIVFHEAGDEYAVVTPKFLEEKNYEVTQVRWTGYKDCYKIPVEDLDWKKLDNGKWSK